MDRCSALNSSNHVHAFVSADLERKWIHHVCENSSVLGSNLYSNGKLLLLVDPLFVILVARLN